MEKDIFVLKYHRGHYTVVKGTITALTKYFGYTLDCGHSWNQKINTKPKTYKSLISNLNKSYQETQGGCYDQDYVTEATEDDWVNAGFKNYLKSEAN